jgi:hypothetical protein
VTTAISKLKQATLELVVVRADGTRENLGVVSHSGWWWNHGPQRLLARWRIRNANRRKEA